MNRLHLEVSESYQRGYSRRITRVSSDHGGKPVEIFHELDRYAPLRHDTPLDGHVLAVFLYAAARGQPLVVHGGMSRGALRNLEELSLIWNRWRPNLYKRFEIVPEHTLDAARQPSRQAAIAAFSGGVDATFTALRHARGNGRQNPSRYPLESVLMVHGFDVDIYNHEDFEKLVTRCRPLLDACNLDLRVIRTNSRDMGLQDWEDTASLQLAACLHMQCHDFQFGLIGSTKAYDELVLPMGSCPVTDHLMSSDHFMVVHDGAGFSRTEKASAIAKHSLACQTLKVCWAGADQSDNCGRCEKCVRTQLNFLASGSSVLPACFPGPLDLDCIRTMQITSSCQVSEFASILSYAKTRSIDADWMPALQERIDSWSPDSAAAVDWVPIKKSVSKALATVGIDEPAKKFWRRVRRWIWKKLAQLSYARRVAH
jgi:hypothetical protein